MIEVRIPQPVYQRMATDLQRPHPFAEERVGYAFARTASLGNEKYIILVCDYVPIQDSNYINDASVGARIDSQAILNSLNLARERQMGAFHVHMHAHFGRPHFSRVDLKYLPGLVRPLRVLIPCQSHGGFLLSEDDFSALVWPPGTHAPITANRAVIVGQPMTFFGDDDE